MIEKREKSKILVLFALVILAGTILIILPASAAVSQWTSTVGQDTVVRFNGTGTTTWTVPSGVTEVEYLVVAGGGGGGIPYGGGGGAGGLLSGTEYPVSPGTTVTVSVGAGGAANAAGEDSVLGVITSHGGGYGNGGSGGSGGGGYGINGLGGNAIAGEGHIGGNGQNMYSGEGGGGGGATSDGGTGIIYIGGAGGDGFESLITGSSVIYATGGGGFPSAQGGSSNVHGNSGGAYGSNAPADTGSGGGGGQYNAEAGSGAGGSGIVIIRYLTVSSGGSASTTINATLQQELSVAITNPFTGNWALSQGANTQNYGNLTITANFPWSESTSATNGDYLKTSGGTPLTNKLQLNSADVTAYTTSGTGSSDTPLNFAQQVIIADQAGSYGTVVTFTVNAV
jgi:hypothetical protein